jgi:hypothetical protein
MCANPPRTRFTITSKRQRLQYAMRERLEHLGWREVETVDENLGTVK